MLCFRSSMLVRSFTVNNISGTRHQPLLHAIHNLFMFVEYCHLLELYVKCAALYRTFIPQSFWNTRCGRPRGRKCHLTRSLVVSEGWSLVRDRTNRKHCPSHEICSYKRDEGWSFDRSSTRPNNASSDRRSLQKFHRKQSVCSKFHQMWVRQSRRERTYVPRYPCSPVPMLPGTYVPR